MKNIIKSLLSLLLFGSMQLEAQGISSNIRLEMGEKKFKPLENYRLNNYHFAWKIVYMDLVSFDSEASNGESFILPSNIVFHTSLKLGKATKPLSKKSEIYLAKSILKKEYFWKSIIPPSSIYGFTSLRFMEKGDTRYKAITELKDIRDMLGALDTMAEWRFWFYATRTEMGITQPYSYKKVGKLHRIRFASVNSFTCVYHEYFNYYDDYGKFVKTKKLKEYNIKGCAIVVI